MLAYGNYPPASAVDWGGVGVHWKRDATLCESLRIRRVHSRQEGRFLSEVSARSGAAMQLVSRRNSMCWKAPIRVMSWRLLGSGFTLLALRIVDLWR